jgi:DNA polymerase III subunit delta'
VSWNRVRGHDALVAAFDRVVRRNRLAHAYLFTGPPGVGKRLFAGELAKALLCEGGGGSHSGLEACDACPACQQVEAESHPDLFVAGQPEDSAAMPIDVVRELSRGLSLKPARGRRKVAILDGADGLNDPITGHAAANCFLKTLEEPPPQSVLILVGTRADRQLPTIVSRCQVVPFAPLPTALVAALLRSQGVEDQAEAEKLARLGGGSPGRARALADPALWDFRDKLTRMITGASVDGVGLAKQWMQFIEEAGKESAAQRRRASLTLHLLMDFLRDVLHRSNAATGISQSDTQDAAAAQQLADRLDPDWLLDVLERCLEAETQVDRRVQLVLVIEALADALGQALRAPAMK